MLSKKDLIGNELLREIVRIRVDGLVAGAHSAKMALIHGKMHRVGDKISVTYGTRKYTWRIKGISKSGLDLEPIPSPRQ